MEKKKLLTIFSHQDDETFSAGGILAKYAKEGGSFALSVTSDPSRENEFKEACKILGCKPLLLDNDKLTPADEVRVRGQIIDKIREVQPDFIITHMSHDYHYEHRLVRKIVEEAVEWVSHTTGTSEAVQISSLWAAETTVLHSFPQIYIDISKFNEKRMKAIDCYESQSHKGGEGFYSKFHGTRTKLRGIQSGVEHAEAFIQIPIAQAGSFKPTKVFEFLPY